MNIPRTVLAFLALTLVLAGCLAGCASDPERAEGVTEADSSRGAR